MKVILAGGGTGGHLYPGIAIANRLKENGVECLFLVSNRGIERETLTELGYPFVEQKTVAFKGAGVLGKIRAIKQLIIEIINVSSRIAKEDKVILLGGFAAASAGAVSVLKGNDLYIHEQNSVMGMTNRFFANRAKKVFLSFDKTYRAKGNGIFVGNPVRDEFSSATAKIKLTKNILVLGGSQGSRSINKLVVQSIDQLFENGFQVKHQTGKKLLHEVQAAYAGKGHGNSERLEITDYISSMKEAYEWADIIISRAGSGSVFEIMYSKRPAIFIPLSIAADNHQMFNAMMAEKMAGASLLIEKSADCIKLVNEIKNIYDNYEGIYEKLSSVEFRDTVDAIIKEIDFD